IRSRFSTRSSRSTPTCLPVGSDRFSANARSRYGTVAFATVVSRFEFRVSSWGAKFYGAGLRASMAKGFEGLVVYQRAGKLSDAVRASVHSWWRLDVWTAGVQLVRA